jgi:hypothetical protein
MPGACFVKFNRLERWAAAALHWQEQANALIERRLRHQLISPEKRRSVDGQATRQHPCEHLKWKKTGRFQRLPLPCEGSNLVPFKGRFHRQRS